MLKQVKRGRWTNSPIFYKEIYCLREVPSRSREFPISLLGYLDGNNLYRPSAQW